MPRRSRLNIVGKYAAITHERRLRKLFELTIAVRREQTNRNRTMGGS